MCPMKPLTTNNHSNTNITRQSHEGILCDILCVRKIEGSAPHTNGSTVSNIPWMGNKEAIKDWQTCLEQHTRVPTLPWRHNERNGVSNHQRLDRLLNCLFRRRSKKTAKLRVTGLCAGNSPVTGEFPAQKVSNAENVSIWWRHHLTSNGLLLHYGHIHMYSCEK